MLSCLHVKWVTTALLKTSAGLHLPNRHMPEAIARLERLRGVSWQSVTDVVRQHIGPISSACSTLEVGTGILSRNVGYQPANLRPTTSLKSRAKFPAFKASTSRSTPIRLEMML